MNRKNPSLMRLASVLVLLLLCCLVGESEAAIEGISGTTTFNLTAKCDFISTPDGNSILIWGYASDDGHNLGRTQYPGPTLIVNEGDVVTVNLTNRITDEQDQLIGENVSLVFPGQTGITTSFTGTADDGGPAGEGGLLTLEARPGGTVTYSFVADRAGTYLYHSGTRPELQVEMGLLGALIVRPAVPGQAYGHSDSQYDHEYLYLLTEMDPRIHDLIESDQMDQIDNTTYRPVYWFINGRNAPDTLAGAFVEWLPTQPYGALTRMTPGDRLLMRVINAGRDLHPFHHHGNHARVIARDGRLLESAPGLGADLSHKVFTIQSVPGQTLDAIFEWTGTGLGWDIYGHIEDVDNDPAGDFPGAGDIDWNGNGVFDLLPPLEPGEDPGSHGKPFPVQLPDNLAMAFGGFWSGSPLMGTEGGLPPGEGGLNPNAGFFFMWHSHTEMEMVNFDLFPGGMMTMMVVEPPGTVIE